MTEKITEPLPIEAIKSSLIAALHSHHTIMLSAPPGAGKSTCLPLWLLAYQGLAGQKIYLLQPRRLAVKNIANFLARQLDEKVGSTVGYRVRNETNVSANTRLEVITEGVLTRIMQEDPELAGCGLIVFDEFHERSLPADLAFAMARDIQQGLRDDLKIMLMSATLASDALLKILPDAAVLKSEGRSYPVAISYHPPASHERWREHALNMVRQSMHHHRGSVLVFLPGVADIQYMARALNEQLPAELMLCPLYGELTLAQQQQAIAAAQPGWRKIVLATNIAETSITIDGIDLVIDCGLENVASYDGASLMNRLSLQQIAKAAAIQRAGRAGRLMAGKCQRLYSKENFERRPEFTNSAILQSDLLPLLIDVARWGGKQLAVLPFIELPNAGKEQLAWAELAALGIIDHHRKLTPHGNQVALLSCHPRFAHMILSAATLEQHTGIKHLASLACLITAMLEERDSYNREQAQDNCDVRHRIVDLCACSKRSNHHLAQRIFQQATQLARRINVQLISHSDHLPLHYTGVLLAHAYPERIARARSTGGDFLCANGKGMQISAQDALVTEPYVVAADLMQTRQGLRVRLAAPIDYAQLGEFFADKIYRDQQVKFDPASEKIIARAQSKLGAMVLTEQINHQLINADSIAALWTALVQDKGLSFLNWQPHDLALRERWRWLSLFVPAADVPKLSDDYLLSSLASWFSPYVGEIKNKTQLDRLDLSKLLLSLLNYQQQQLLNQLAPASYLGPTGRKCPISYSEQRSPKVSLPLQEVYGLSVTPSVGVIGNNAGIPLILELLSPAKRPIQVTQDLVQFFQGSYKAVQKDMKSQYPKHYWPDDPANAKPTNRVKKHLDLS